jgi:hypothetical protein
MGRHYHANFEKGTHYLFGVGRPVSLWGRVGMAKESTLRGAGLINE